jgi:DNA-binding beta-propeller fold protein YncE
MKSKHSALALFAISSLLALASCNDRQFDNPFDPDAVTSAYEILSTFQVVGIAPVDLTFSGDALWLVDAQARVLALNYNTGAPIRELEFPQGAGGVAYDGEDLWLSIRNSPQLVLVNIVNGAPVRMLNLPRGSLGPLEYSGGKLYVTDRLSNAILIVDPQNGAIERSIPQPGFAIDGVSYDGASLWTIDASQMKIFRLAADGAPENQYQAPSRSTSGLAYAGGIFWCGDQAGKIYRLRFQ